MADEKRGGIFTNGEQDEKIFALFQKLAVQNERLRITNDRLEKVCDCLETQERRMQKLEKEVTRHGVYIGLVAMGIGILITQFINKVWAIVGR
jgi:hypothetical protein